jgi:hypothetical protein
MEKRVAWNKGRIIGQKAPLKQQEIWAIRTRLEIAKNTRELALLNLAIDSKLRGCDLVSLKVSDVMRSGEVMARPALYNTKLARQCNSKSPHRREKPSKPGSNRRR